MIENKKQMFIVIGVFALVLLLGTTTYAFFNYTRTGAANTIGTGRIAFDTSQSDTVTLSDLFPITTNGAVTSSTPGVGSLSIHVTGDTTYTNGIEYLVKAVNVTGSNGTNLPISISIGYAATTGEGNTIGTEDADYFTNRGGNTSRYKVLSNDTIEEGTDLVVGYIAPGATGIDGYITVMAYLDARNIAITDTYPAGVVRTVKENLDSSQISACVTALSSLGTTEEVTAFCNGTGTISFSGNNKTFQQALDDDLLTSAQYAALVEGGVIDEYEDGTESTWVNSRTVFTTAEWNELQASGVSFQIKVEANEGTWVPTP